MTETQASSPAKALLLLPVLVLLALFFVSVFQLFSNGFADADGWSLRYFRQILNRSDYQVIFARTILSSLTVALVSVALSYPIALLLWRLERWRNTLLIVVLVPWLVSLVVRTYGWLVLLGPKGVINGMLAWTGIIQQPLALMFNDLGIVIGLTHVLIPFAVISILSSLLAIESNLEEASGVLGANRFQTFRRIVLPLSLPGAFTALIVNFLASIGAIVTPIVLGGMSHQFVGSQIYQEVMYTFNLNKAAAWSICLLAISFLSLLLLKAIERRLIGTME